MSIENLLSLRQVASRENVSTITVRKWIADGRITPEPTRLFGHYVIDPNYRVDYPPMGRPKTPATVLREQRRSLTADMHRQLTALITWMGQFEGSIPEQIKPVFEEAKSTVALYESAYVQPSKVRQARGDK